MIAPHKVSVAAVSEPKITPVVASRTPETMWVLEIIRTRPTLSNSGLSSSAPRKLLAAKIAMYQPVCLTPRNVVSVSR
jgi:hypothetical protein